MEIYLVSQGEYSDYRIRETFLDKSIAEKYAAKIDGIVETFETADEKILTAMKNQRKYYELRVDLTEKYDLSGRKEPIIKIYSFERDTLIDEPRCAGYGERTFYKEFGERSLFIPFISKKRLNPKNESVQEKYRKIIKDKFMHIQSLRSNEGWTVDMVNDWLREEYKNELI
jgi:hypothetical protein